MQANITQLIEDITAQDWGIIPDFLPAHLTHVLAQDLLRRQGAGEFKPAGVGKAQIRTDIRGDATLWWQDADLIDAQKTYYQNINTLREALNEAFFISLQTFECHYASYPIGAFYQRHLDSFRQNNSRFISCILYLNTDWQASEGGALRVYNADNETHTDIFPTFGTLVCMRSETMWHEVLPVHRTRYSITGWLRRQDIF